MIDISIVVPVYNADRYLEKCIESLLKQTLTNIEIILVNDGSTDKSKDICNEYAKKDTRIKVIHKKNEGVSVARNKGIDFASGKYIMFCDSDDYTELDWCECLYNKISNNKNALVISNYNIHNYRDNKNQIKKKQYYNELKTKIDKSEFYNLYEMNLTNQLWNKIYNLDIIKSKNIRFNEKLSLGEDLIFNLEYLEYVDSDILIENKCLYNYILRNRDSLDNKYYSNLFDIYKLLYESLYKIYNL